jgi:hypothetical protein
MDKRKSIEFITQELGRFEGVCERDCRVLSPVQRKVFIEFSGADCNS